MDRLTESGRHAGRGRTVLPRPLIGCMAVALVCGGVLGGNGVCQAQTAVEMAPLAAAYGSGVHAYFAGDYDRSFELLGSAIGAGIEDPRAWYFRGLAALRLGRVDEAEADFTEGAERESSRAGRWPVSRSLERVQGADRLRLERHRVRALVAALQRDRDAVHRRYNELDEAQPEVLRRRPAGRGRTGDDGPFGAKVTPESIPIPAPAPTPTPPDDFDDPFNDATPAQGAGKPGVSSDGKPITLEADGTAN